MEEASFHANTPLESPQLRILESKLFQTMWSRPSRSMRCSGCGLQLAVPSHARAVRCAVCNAVTIVRSSDDPVRQAVGFVKSAVSSISNGISSMYGSSSSYNRWTRDNGYSNHIVALPPSFPRVHGKKRALLVGISYTSTKYELKGTVNDVNCMRYLLCEKLGFPSDCVLVLTEEERDFYHLPTKDNLRAAMQWLVSGCEAGDSLVFHYSGHAVQRLDPSGDEKDGYDEALCPLDFETRGTIVDDELNAIFVRPLPRGVRLHAIVDACHSGTILDLPFLCRLSKAGFYQWENHNPVSGIYKGTNGGLAILFSGCGDDQTSADTSALAGSTTTGAMTYSFIQALENEPGTTYGRLLMAMRSAIRDASTGIRLTGPLASLMRKVFNFGLTQEPQLSSTETFDIYRKPFLL